VGEGSTVPTRKHGIFLHDFYPGKGIGLLYERNDYREIVFTRIKPIIFKNYKNENKINPVST
jgi:hypothetical protein